MINDVQKGVSDDQAAQVHARVQDEGGSGSADRYAQPGRGVPGIPSQDQLLSVWKQEFLANASKAFESENHSSETQARVDELERVVGRLTLELEIAKKASNILEATRTRNGW